MFGFKKQSKEISRTTPGYEEDERRVPKTGILLLIVMFISGIFFGWRALDDIASLPAQPERISYCGDMYRGNTLLSERIVSPMDAPYLYQDDYYTQYQRSGCRFNTLEKEAGIPALIQKRNAIEDQRQPLFTQYSQLQSSLSEIRYQIDRYRGDYSIGLQEKTAGVTKPLYPLNQSGGSIDSLRSEEQRLSAQIAELKLKIDPFDEDVKKLDKQIEIAYKPVFERYNRQLRWYEFEVFMLQMLFVFPFFWLVFAWYLKLHRKNSPYTLIFTAMVMVASILLLRVILFWFWGLFLEELLRILSEWFARYEIFRTLLFYGGMLLSFLIFGGAVYYLQKKVFDPRRVAIRRFRSHQCPKCQSSLELSEQFCPNCAYHLREVCPTCGKDRFIDLPVCPHCGTPKVSA